jgi:hypothetical protein
METALEQVLPCARARGAAGSLSMRSALVWSALAVLLLTVRVVPGGATITPVQRCAATKQKLAGKEFAALMVCDAKAVGKGVAVDPACDAKVTAAFSTAWGKAETKKGGCSTTDDETAIGGLVGGVQAYLETGLVVTGAPSTCTAAKFRAAGSKGACELSCSATAALKGLPLGAPSIAACLSGCSERLSRAFAKAEMRRKGACHTMGDAAVIQTAVDGNFFIVAKNDLISCPAGQIGCSGTCLDPSADAANCGSCANICGRNETCSGGACVCGSPFTLCPIQAILKESNEESRLQGNAATIGINPCDVHPCICTDVDHDPVNCNACGTQCPSTASFCVAGQCACPSPNVVCGPFCTNPASDRANCGACGHVCPIEDTFCVEGSCSPTTTVYPRSNALGAPLLDELAAFAHGCVSIFLDDSQNECGGCFDGGSSCCLADICCNEEDHHQGLARTQQLSDGSIYFFLSHSGVQGPGDTGRIMQFRYGGPVDDEHVTGQGVTAPMEQRLLLDDETHPSAITFLPDVNHFDSGYLFVAKEYDAQKVTVYYWKPGSDLQPIGDIFAGLTKPSHVVIDKVGDDYYLVVFDNTYKNGSPYRAFSADLFPSGTPGTMNVSAFQVLPYFTFKGDLGSQAQLIQDSTQSDSSLTRYLIVYNSPDDSGFGDDYVHIRSIQLGDQVTLPQETLSPIHFFFPEGGTSFTNTGTHWVDHSGRLLISSSERWAQDEGVPFGWESRVDECVPVN